MNRSTRTRLTWWWIWMMRLETWSRYLVEFEALFSFLFKARKLISKPEPWRQGLHFFGLWAQGWKVTARFLRKCFFSLLFICLKFVYPSRFPEWKESSLISFHQTCDWETLTGLLTAEKRLAIMELFTFTCKDNSLKLRSSLVRQ